MSVPVGGVVVEGGSGAGITGEGINVDGGGGREMLVVDVPLCHSWLLLLREHSQVWRTLVFSMMPSVRSRQTPSPVRVSDID